MGAVIGGLDEMMWVQFMMFRKIEVQQAEDMLNAPGGALYA